LYLIALIGACERGEKKEKEKRCGARDERKKKV
jgi:hypothetical protein